ncbi:hypothetical protein [Arthrobacter antioxidans]|uniref:hypothetical protein n=1 Tax=Arthrobacter antioxidans TaxID=2895818 RepID=UPI001FFE454A|nr:hypothetical protein [Arthrobacter antioxidans]
MALARELTKVTGVAKGTRNDVLNRAAFNRGQLVGSELPESLVRDALTEAATQAGLDSEEVGPTIESGLAQGMAQPQSASEGI